MLLGAWLGVLLCSWLAATANFRLVDRVLGAGRPELEARLAPLEAADRRMVLRHLASEINRFLFRALGAIQLAAGAASLALAWRAGTGPRIAVAAALAALLAQSLLTGPIVELGRQIDFVPRPLPPETARGFGALHAGYVALDLAKAALLLAATWLLGRTGPI